MKKNEKNIKQNRKHNLKEETRDKPIPVFNKREKSVNRVIGESTCIKSFASFNLASVCIIIGLFIFVPFFSLV